WLRYVALCSPAIGNEMREVSSTARRFEMVDLSQNAFADVSSFVQLLKDDDRLSETYPDGLVEAAYAMSSGNFGWFNVVMANVDGVIAGRRAKGEPTDAAAGELFDETVRVSSRMSEYVLDHNAIAELDMPRDKLDVARDLLYGQLPVPLDQWIDAERQSLLAGTNEYGEPIAILYQKVKWSDQECSKALRVAKFTRYRDEWLLTGVDQPLDLTQLLANLSTYSIHETKGAAETGDRRTYLIPLNCSYFVHLVSMLYPHPAAEDAARAIWREQIDVESVGDDRATHVGPSIDMLDRLNLRFRRHGTTSLIFRESDQSSAHESAMESCKGQAEDARAKQILTGAMRALDENWDYDTVDAGLKGDLVAITTAASRGRGGKGGLVDFNALPLHPDGTLIMAWARSVDELEEICRKVSEQRSKTGRVPVVVFTSSRHLWERFQQPTSQVLKDAHDYLMLYQLSSREEYVLRPIGLLKKDCKGFQLHPARFTMAFANRLRALLRPLREAAHEWRRSLDRRGRIAWPMRASGVVKDEDRDALYRAYRVLFVENSPPKVLAHLDETSGLDVQDVLATLERMRISPKAKAAGYQDSERFGLFTTLDESAEPRLSSFLQRICDELMRGQEWSYGLSQREWFWGYSWEGARPTETYIHWMALLCELGFAEETSTGTRKTDKRYKLVSRAGMRGALTEARNWLNDDYPTIVQRMKQVFGVGKVSEYFAPLDASHPGTKTLLAKEKLDYAQTCQAALDVAEPSWKDAETVEDRVAKFTTCARNRLISERNITHVYRADDCNRLVHDENIRTLNFENDAVPLWRRIRQADLFVDYVRNGKQRIKKRIESLSSEMRDSTQDIEGFPVRLFTRSLEKIANILDGSIGSGPAKGETQRA
ncbi:MAG: hypothetical protein ACC645_09055, partial [Pirellulales bacterium]